MITVKSVVLVLISPLKFAFILCLFAILSRVFKRSKFERIFFGVAIGWVLVFSQPYVADLLLFPLEYAQKEEVPPSLSNQSSRYVFPLACYYQTHTTIPEISRWPECSLLRMLMAKNLAQHYDAKIIVTGGFFLHDKNVNYAERAAHFFIQQGWPKNQLLVQKTGSNTREELLAVKSIVHNSPVIIVTSATHTYRVERLAEDLNINAKVVSASYNSGGKLTPYLRLPSAEALLQSQSAFYEYLAILKYHLQRLQ
jgi:uncharacterized SAM-binding protein YcdF (DUF218 family)